MGNTGKSGNGNGGLKDDSNHDDDDDRPTSSAIGHRENRRMLSILADYLTEAKTHSTRLETLYNALKEMTVPVSPVWTGTLLNEFERHHEAEGQNLSTLRAYMQNSNSLRSTGADEENDSDDEDDSDDD